MLLATEAFSGLLSIREIRRDSLSKSIAIKLLLSPRARRFAIRLLKDPRVRRVIVKLVARRLRR